ncbi:ABC transporter ATP-binding protein [Terriglobus albidus]|uniref:ABC transporter ATP-binding protein n=1 Tax=Terriglobus albidus TaxID=1592106 RepID=UPI0021E0F668|nr:ABC transporter ATP-binding protein [Terriglobus albidus]
MSKALLDVRGLSKSYATGRGRLELFRELSFEVAEGEMVAIVGESGAGKSSLLHLLAALDKPDAGEVYLDAIRVDQLSLREQAEFRNRQIGYVWQFHYLLPEFTAEENVAMPLLARGTARPEAISAARRWLSEVELGDRFSHRTGELSGGEQQRVSLARALVTQPRLLFADEPTGDLDNRTGDVVFSLIQRLHKAHGLTSVLVTHNLEFAGRCDRILRLRNGGLRPAN